MLFKSKQAEETELELEQEEETQEEKQPGFWERLKEKLPKVDPKISMKILSFFIGFGYVAFFSSRLLLPGGISAEFTPLNTPVSFPGTSRTVTISRWVYSPSQNLMEVELVFKDSSFDVVESYALDSMIKTFSIKQQPVDVILNTSDLCVVHIPVPQSFRAVSLRMLPDVEDVSADQIVKVYTNPSEVQVVDHIEAKTETEYRRELILSNVSLYEEQIQAIKEEISQLRTTIENVEKRNKDLEQSKRYSTDKEIMQINTDIESNNRYIEQLENQIISNNRDMTELQEKIENTKKQAEDLK